MAPRIRHTAVLGLVLVAVVACGGTEPLCAIPNVVITPHIASGSNATFKKMGMMAAENIIGALTGKMMPSCLNPAALANRTGNA